MTPNNSNRAEPRITEKISGYVMRAFAGSVMASRQKFDEILNKNNDMGASPVFRRSIGYFPGESLNFVFFFINIAPFKFV